MTIESANDNVKISPKYCQNIVAVSSKYRQNIVTVLSKYCRYIVKLLSIDNNLTCQGQIMVKSSTIDDNLRAHDDAERK